MLCFCGIAWERIPFCLFAVRSLEALSDGTICLITEEKIGKQDEKCSKSGEVKTDQDEEKPGILLAKEKGKMYSLLHGDGKGAVLQTKNLARAPSEVKEIDVNNKKCVVLSYRYCHVHNILLKMENSSTDCKDRLE